MTRIDKFLWSVRIYKTRSLATKDVKNGKIDVNHQSVKPSYEVKINDVIEVKKQGVKFSYKVINLLDKRVGAKLVDEFILNQTSQEERDKLEVKMAAQKQYKNYGTGKPSKKDRREIDDFWEDLF